jgi:hypothetical protein
MCISDVDVIMCLCTMGSFWQDWESKCCGRYREPALTGGEQSAKLHGFTPAENTLLENETQSLPQLWIGTDVLRARTKSFWKPTIHSSNEECSWRSVNLFCRRFPFWSAGNEQTQRIRPYHKALFDDSLLRKTCAVWYHALFNEDKLSLVTFT